MSDVKNVYEITQLLLEMGVKKSQQRIDHTIIKSFLAGVFLSFGGLFSLIVGGASAPLAQNLGPGIQRLVQAAVFPIGLTFIMITGTELFTSNTMILTMSTLQRKTRPQHLVISWSVSYCGNLAGCLFFEGILVYYAGIVSNDPYRTFIIRLTEVKGSIEWYQMFLRGIAGNWLVCLAVWLAISGRDLHSKIFGIFLPIWLFVAVGYEHSIANMFSVQLGMMFGANLSIGKYISGVMIPVTLGNLVGGALFAGIAFWYLYAPRMIKTDNKEDVEFSTNKHCQIVQANKELKQAEKPLSILSSY